MWSTPCVPGQAEPYEFDMPKDTIVSAASAPPPQRHVPDVESAEEPETDDRQPVRRPEDLL